MIKHTGPCTQWEPVLPNSMGSPRYTKWTPPWPVVANSDSVTYRVAKFIGGIPKPFVGKSQHCICNIQHFVEQIKDIAVGLGEYSTSYDITALFTSVPVAPALNIVQNKSGSGSTLKDQYNSTAHQGTVRLCLHNTSFLFECKSSEQGEGMVKEFPVSPIIANIYILRKMLLKQQRIPLG